MAAEPIDNQPTGVDQARRIVVDECQTMLAVVRAARDNIERMVWASPYGNTPQQLCDSLSNRAKALVTVMTAAKTLITVLRANLKEPGAAPLDLKPSGSTWRATTARTAAPTPYGATNWAARTTRRSTRSARPATSGPATTTSSPAASPQPTRPRVARRAPA